MSANHKIVNSRGSRRRQRIFAMVFGGMEGFDEANDMYDRLQNLRAANGIKVLGSGVIKVVNRVEDARENSSLVQKVVLACEEAKDGGVVDLSNCQLIQVPVAVYFMMKQTTLTSCNLSFNVIKKISPKFPIQFNNLTELNLSNNQISNLPDEFEESSKNFISDIDVEATQATETIEFIDVEDNPLSRPCLDLLASGNLDTITIKFTSRELEEWEDLSI
ncbi:unnamed protein product [Lepeophtheirus salmonis]|uniref:(salmon louse) hypothetical protein n=1 Tax=Lepeophtheirus salmonis TaxID=72036 RepID=A0A7R8CZI1_LEPSM|nr:unnamed protein product [Lepeophtheirus salmonis]CAF2976343.1 unnamed protein product [Lepeophtheirus salmonis]